MSEKSHFEVLASIDVSKQCEKKNGFTYLSWAWAVDTLLRADPTACWEYGEPMRFNESVMVFCTVTAFGKPMTMQLPVIDFRNKPISNPSAMDVNTAMMRCLVKAIALHGLGLYIYAGEDIPEESKKPITPLTGAWESMDEESQKFLQGIADDVIKTFKISTIKDTAEMLARNVLDNDEKAALWTRFDSKLRAAIKNFNAEKKVQVTEASFDEINSIGDK
jgi:hypothetical protein